MSDIESIIKRERSWVFTINNPEYNDFKFIEKCLEEDQVKYLVYGKEEGDEKEVPHLQGFAYFHNKKSLTQLKKVLPRAHWEVKKGSFIQAIAYCKKDGDVFEYGDPPLSSRYLY